MKRFAFAAAIALAAPAASTGYIAPQGINVERTAGAFIDQVVTRAFAVLQDRTLSKPAMKTKFRSMLRDNFAVDDIGNRLIRRQRAVATPDQLAQYKAALPNFVINAYADRLSDYAGAELKVIRQVERAPGLIDVYSTVQTAGHPPRNVVWTVSQQADGRFAIAGITASGINLTMTQEADFNAYVAKNGFQALIDQMSNANSRGL